MGDMIRRDPWAIARGTSCAAFFMCSTRTGNRSDGTIELASPSSDSSWRGSSQYCTTSSELMAARAISCHPTTRFPRSRTRAAARSTNAACASSGIPHASSPPMCTYALCGNCGMTASSTSSTNAQISGRSGSKVLSGMLVPSPRSTDRSSAGASSGYALNTAVVCPGISISGTTVTNRSAAYATSSASSSRV